MCPRSFSSRNRVSLRVLISTLVFQQLVIQGHGSQNYFNVLKDDDVSSSHDAMTLNKDILKCNIYIACHFVVKDNSQYLLSNDAARTKEGFVGEIVWMKMAGL